MEKRRLQRTGGASLTVTLPKKWISHQRLQEKDQVSIYTQTSGSLLLKATSRQHVRRPALLAGDGLTPEMITREATALYIAGVEEIEFRSPVITPAQRAHLRQLTQTFMGFEIVDESAKKVVLRNILDVSKLTIPDTVDKMFLATRSMLEDAMSAVIHGKRAGADIADRDREIDKLYLVIKRQFHAALSDRISEEEINLNRSDLNYYRTIALQLERIADHAVKIAQVIPGDMPPLPTGAQTPYRQLLTQLLTLMIAVHGSVHKPTRPVAHHMLDQNKSLEDAIARLHHHPRGAGTRIMLNDSLDRVRGYLINTAEAIIDRAVSQQIS